jgi:DNA repair protein RadC
MQTTLFDIPKHADQPQIRYAYRIKTSKIKEPDFPYSGQITGTKELVDFLQSLQLRDIEQFVAIYLSAQNDVQGIYTIEGGPNQSAVFHREVIRHALLFSACAIILAHNHPSGHTRPSEADIRLTKVVVDAAKIFDILVHDHIIVTENLFFSFRDKGMMPC